VDQFDHIFLTTHVAGHSPLTLLEPYQRSSVEPSAV